MHDANIAVERVTTETASTFGTRQLQLSQVGKENIVINHDDEMSCIIECTNIQQ